ncbi:hypothetical protein K0P33_16015 [Pseudomonas sp. ArH3a]|uniref:hypothetical protein n=1 Tax=Pseudomonas sp. ArH3a TaxID=2862945 RepID=UPI001F5A8F18|nr:hypothetical protein [Pseudomonas sp. ArH3a]UNM17104.1 hypothetical protein K0P33_16015 [Pseudomonas sp. ArH3a]
MSESMLVRASREGDQFHYLWAARRPLRLLTLESGFIAITIEGRQLTSFLASSLLKSANNSSTSLSTTAALS